MDLKKEIKLLRTGNLRTVYKKQFYLYSEIPFNEIDEKRTSFLFIFLINLFSKLTLYEIYIVRNLFYTKCRWIKNITALIMKKMIRMIKEKIN